MTPETKLIEAIKTKAQTEWNKISQNAKALPPEQIMSRAFEIGIKEAILDDVINGDWLKNQNEEALESLSKSNSPLADIYCAWERADGDCFNIYPIFELAADELVKELAESEGG